MKAGLNMEDVIEVISKGAAQSWQMENRWQTMIEDKYNHGFAVDLMRKDLEIVLKTANESDINMEITELVNNFYKDIQSAGGGKWDTSSLLKRLEELIQNKLEKYTKIPQPNTIIADDVSSESILIEFISIIEQ